MNGLKMAVFDSIYNILWTFNQVTLKATTRDILGS